MCHKKYAGTLETIALRMHLGYFEQLISDLVHLHYDVFLLNLQGGSTLAGRSISMLRSKVITIPLGSDVAKRLIAVDELWGRKLLQMGAELEAWIAESQQEQKNNPTTCSINGAKQQRL
jgi:hypothetical protein